MYEGDLPLDEYLSDRWRYGYRAYVMCALGPRRLGKMAMVLKVLIGICC
jgi:hypothetical protein